MESFLLISVRIICNSLTSARPVFLCPKVDLSLQDIFYVCYPHMVPGNGCNGCFTEMRAKAQNHFKG